MESKVVQFIPKGMNRDISKSKLSNNYMYDAMNIRITAREHSTALSITNEKGNKEVTITPTQIEGQYIGSAILNNYVVIFTTNSGTDRIYRLEYKPSNFFESKLLFQGNLGFNVEYPIEALSIYENDNIQKIYWTDGLNRPRVINIIADPSGYTNNSFDFVQVLGLKETLKVSRIDTANGVFAPGVIQYAMTYFNKYGQESNIFATSDLLYTSFGDRGGSPEDKVSNSFRIELSNVDTSFEYIRLYSIYRTSIDATPVVKNVADIVISGSTVSYVDTNTTGSSMEPTELLYVGGEDVVFKTMTQKDNTLFLGNYKINRKLVTPTIKNSLRGGTINFSTKDLYANEVYGTYPYINQLKFSSSQITTFKYGETYRFGIQFQHKTGKWSEAIFINDSVVNQHPSTINVMSSGGRARYKLVTGYYDLNNATTIQQLVDLGYIRARGVVVYPSPSDRTILCQGIVCPTVANIKDRINNSPYAQSSWFCRPFAPGNISTQDWDKIPSPLACIHNYPLSQARARGSEIQSNDAINRTFDSYKKFSSTQERLNYVSPYDDQFVVDQNIVTFHSPDIEFNDDLQSIDGQSVKFRIVGVISLDALQSDVSVLAETPNPDPSDLGLYKPFIQVNSTSLGNDQGWKVLSSAPLWMAKGKKDANNLFSFPVGWMVYPWHRNGSLVNVGNVTEGEKIPAKLKQKKLSNLRYSLTTSYFDISKVWYAERDDENHNGITNVNIFNSNEVSLVKINPPTNSGLGNLNYYGNVDRVLAPGFYGEWIDSKGYTIYLAGWNGGSGYEKGDYNTIFNSTVVSTYNLTEITNNNMKYFTEPISMKYKSTPHAVFAFNYTSKRQQVILPDNGNNPISTAIGGVDVKVPPVWLDSFPTTETLPIYQDIISGATSAGLWIGELYNDNVVNRFGGTSEEALEANRWVAAGPVVNLVNGSSAVTSARIIYNEGDTYFQRYDCLKTYPFTLEDQNSMTEIISFMCETRVNIDGRYDRNRGQSNNLVMTPQNFNLLNPVYSQKNNFFNYRSINYNRYNIDYFPNSITWTKTKSLGELTDTWTNITVASTLDLDGDKGELRLLEKLGNEIFSFQDKGIANILFNSRVQIPTSEGVPIEISNSYKVDGKRYVTISHGLQNKWAKTITPSGMYFIDNITNDIMLFNGQQLSSISSEKGFRTFIGETNSLTEWNSRDFSNYIIQYDATNDDVYFIKKDTCLCYSELLQEFTSFFNYENVPFMFNMNGNFYSYKNNTIWQHELGDYNSFYGELKPYYVTVVCNPEEPYDKIFNVVEYRADFYDQSGVFMPLTSFDKLEVWNEYQSGLSMLSLSEATPSNLKKKFNVWRALVPRDSTNGRDRIRNTWAYVKLSNICKNTYRAELHDIMVHYNV